MENKVNDLEIKKGNLKFYIGDDEANPLAKITFIYKADNLVIEHTIVNDSLKGQGVAKTLVEAVVTFAKQEKVKIIPVCDYAKKVLTQDDTYRDVLASEVLQSISEANKEV
jgi:hypothetical protein